MPCKLFDGGAIDDFLMIEPQGKSIAVDDIRTVTEWAFIKPVYAKKKVYIIRSADRMTVQAQNALLKTLEEPPQYITAILTAENPEILLDTIRSRCMMIQFSRYSFREIREILQRGAGFSEFPAEKQDFLVALSGGIPGKAMELCVSQAFFSLREEVLALFSGFLRGDVMAGFRLTEFLESNRETFNELMDILISWLRDLWICIIGGNTEILVNSDKKAQILDCLQTVCPDALLEIVEYMDGIKASISANANFTLTVNAMLLRINKLREVN